VTPAEAAIHARGHDWDKLRQRVRATREALGLAIDDVAAAIGHTSSTTRGRLSMRTPPSEAMQGRLRAWVEDMSRAVAPAAGGASQARHGHGHGQGGLAQGPTPGPAPPSAGDTRPRMCAPSAKNLASPEAVSINITDGTHRFDPASAPGVINLRVTVEYEAVRLPDHNFRGQAEALTKLGALGFELVCISGGVAYLRRRLDMERERIL
jgi:hypothetical protein